MFRIGRIITQQCVHRSVDGELKDEILAKSELIRVKLAGDGQIITIYTKIRKWFKPRVRVRGRACGEVILRVNLCRNISRVK